MKDRPEYFQNFLLVINSMLFGLGSWVAITGLWLEVPVLIYHLPEGWSLASYLTFAIQLANIAPFIYWFIHSKYSKYCNEISATNLQLLIGIIASIILIFYWEIQTNIYGQQRSIILIFCAFLLSIVDCLSSITFLPFMGRFRSVYLTPYLIGEGLSGFLPTILAILQNIEEIDENKINTNITANQTMAFDKQLLFGPETFFISLLITLIISWIAFFYLQLHQPSQFQRRNSLPLPVIKRKLTSKEVFSKYFIGLNVDQRKIEDLHWEHRKNLIYEQEKLNREIKKIVKSKHSLRENNPLNSCSFNMITVSPFNSNCEQNNVKSDLKKKKFIFNREQFQYYYLQFLIFFACTITFGLMPPIQPFACLPVSHSTLKYSVILAGLSYPIGCSFAVWFKCKSLHILNLLTFTSLLIVIYIIYCALHSPSLPPIIFNSFNSSIININNNNKLNININYYNQTNDNYLEKSTLKYFLMHINKNQSTVLSLTMITGWVIFNLILSYVKTMITLILNDTHGQDALFFVGIYTQFGSVLGAGFMYFAINHFKWFKQH